MFVASHTTVQYVTTEEQIKTQLLLYFENVIQYFFSQA